MHNGDLSALWQTSEAPLTVWGTNHVCPDGILIRMLKRAPKKPPSQVGNVRAEDRIE